MPISAAANAKIRSYSYAHGQLTEEAPIQLPTTTPAGKALNPFPAGLAITPDGKRLVVADQLADAVSVVDLAGGNVATVPAGHRPLSVTVSPNGATAYVNNQGASDVSAVDIAGAEPKVARTIPVGLHFVKAMPYKEVL